MFDLLNSEEGGLIDIAEAIAMFPESCRPTASTVHKWARRGDLESTFVGGRRFTSRQAVLRFRQKGEARAVAAST
jgi:uncharacterized protein DUF1580